MAAFSRDFSMYERKENARENPDAKPPKNIPEVGVRAVRNVSKQNRCCALKLLTIYCLKVVLNFCICRPHQKLELPARTFHDPS